MAALWKVVLHGYDLQVGIQNEILNVFGYRSNLTVINEVDELDTSFQAHVLPAVLNAVHGAYSAFRIEYYNVTDGIGYKDTLLVPQQTGARTGDKMPTFVSWSFKYQRASVGKRSGGKRFGPIAETDVADGNATSGAMVQLNALAAALAAPLPLLTINTWFPEILERKPTGVFPWTSHPIAGVVYEAVSTQNSRKR